MAAWLCTSLCVDSKAAVIIIDINYQSVVADDHITDLLALQSIQSPHGPRVQLDCIRDIGEHLLEGVGRLLVEQNPHCLAGFDAAADDGDQFGFDEVFGLPLQLVLQRDEGGEGARCARLAAHGPVGVDVLGVVHASEGLVGGAHVALTWGEEKHL